MPSFVSGRASIPAIIAAATILGVAQTADAASIALDAVHGSWTAVTPDDTVNLNGIGTSQIRWGTTVAGSQQSGYRFDGATDLPKQLNEGVDFLIGTFTHMNFPIAKLPEPFSILGATLSLSFDISIDGMRETLTNQYQFTHWETDNQLVTCDNGQPNGMGLNINGCADRVQATLNESFAETFTVGGTEYAFSIGSFEFALEDAIPTFWTIEQQSNSAQLFGVFTETPPVAPIPLPASAALLLAGLGGLAAMRRRRKPV